MNRRRSTLIAVGCLLLVTIIWGWPLLRELKTAIPGVPSFVDITELIWDTGWVRHALTSEAALFETDTLLVPFKSNLRLIAYGLLTAMAAFPLTLFLGVVGAFNVVVLLTFFLNGVVTYFFLRSEVGGSWAALVGAVWLMLSVPVLGQIGNGRASLGAIWVVTGAIWALKRTLDQPHPRNGLFLGLLFSAALLADFQIVFMTTIWLAFYAAYQLLIVRRIRLDKPRLKVLGLAGLIVLVTFSITYLPVLTAYESGGFPVPRLNDMLIYSFQMQHYFTPALWPLVAGGYELVTVAVLTVLIFRHRGGYLFWLLGAGGFLLLALGPYLQPTEIPLPFAALSLFEPLRQFRTPARLTMAVVVGLAVVAAYGLNYLMARIRSPTAFYSSIAGDPDRW